MRVDLLEETLDRLERDGRRPKFIYTVPSFQNPAGVTMSLERRRRLVEIAHERELLVLEDNPYGLLRYEGEPQPTLCALDGGVYVMYLGTFSKILSPGIRLGWVVAPPPVLEKINLGKQAADLCTSTLSQLHGRGVLRARATGATTWTRSPRSTARAATRCSTRWPSSSRPRPSGPARPAGCSSGSTLPDFIDTTDLLARALREQRRVRPGRGAPTSTAAGAARCGSTSPASDEDAIREGVRRIGKVVNEQVALYGTLTGEGSDRAGRPRERRRAARMPTRPPRAAPTSCSCAARGARRRPRAGDAMSRVAVLKGGRSLERQVSLRSGARVEDALERLGHDVVPDRRGRRPDRAAARGDARGRVRRAARPRRRGRHRPGAARDPRHALHRAPACSACMRAMDKVLAKHLLTEAGIPTPEFFAFTETAFQRARRRRRAAGDRGAARLPDRGEAGGRRLGARDQVRALAPSDVPAALVAAFSYDSRVLLERYVEGRDLACRMLDGRRRARGAADRRGGAARRGLLRLRGALRDRPHRLRLPGRAARRA